MASRLRESDKFADTHVAGWESRDGTYRTVYDSDDVKVGRQPSDRSLERAERIVFIHEGHFYTVGPLTDDYGLDDAIAELEDRYSE